MYQKLVHKFSKKENRNETENFTEPLAAAALLLLGSLSFAEAQEANPPTQILITNVQVWDGLAKAPVARDVLIEGSMIKKVAKGISAAGATKIDGKGGTLIPGLIDSHQHIMATPGVGPDQFKNSKTPYLVAYEAVPQARKLLMMGVTTIRDLGGPSLDLARAIDQGMVAGPRIYSSGAFISSTSGHGDYTDATSSSASSVIGSSAWWLLESGWVYLADGADEVRKASRLAISKGAPQIKIMAGGGVASLKDPLESVGYSEAEMRAAVEAATDYDTYVMAHAYNDESVQRAIRAGVKDIVHGHLLSEKTIKMMAKNEVWRRFPGADFIHDSAAVAGLSRRPLEFHLMLANRNIS